ncbi:hypothetical protein NW762_011395 [Fusarium torreyae]|uniref:3CxxC-type domain-containing protein n=1 Tax=Fusarium torreyae TaxID=1237075 RepID=A0A9W8RRU8_9HYPO|nr:hypothetical protein NW762_011395 [Fusarium torreyae]
MPRRGSKPKAWSMFPDLHGQVSTNLDEDGLDYSFNNNDDDYSSINDYDSSIMGRFSCRNHKCSTNGWSSKKIPITIREYPGDRYNVRVYHQRCRQCKSLSRPKLDEKSYIDRVTYRIKKWNGVEVEAPVWSGKTNAPHEQALCEGCKDGHCEMKTRGFVGIEWA